MVRSGIVFVMLAVGVVLSGCSQGASPTKDPPEGRLEEALALETTAEPAVPPRSDAGPPDSTLGYGDRAVTGVVGSYCWSSGSSASCVDGGYSPAFGKGKHLAVPVGSEMVFDYGGEGPPGAVRAGAEPLGPGGEPAGPSRRLNIGGSGGRVPILAELPAGDYVVDVFVRVPEGDASYYFRVIVERDGAALPATRGPEP